MVAGRDFNFDGAAKNPRWRLPFARFARSCGVSTYFTEQIHARLSKFRTMNKALRRLRFRDRRQILSSKIKGRPVY
jgi:hypothetical protein